METVAYRLCYFTSAFPAETRRARAMAVSLGIQEKTSLEEPQTEIIFAGSVVSIERLAYAFPFSTEIRPFPANV